MRLKTNGTNYTLQDTLHNNTQHVQYNIYWKFLTLITLAAETPRIAQLWMFRQVVVGLSIIKDPLRLSFSSSLGFRFSTKTTST